MRLSRRPGSPPSDACGGGRVDNSGAGGDVVVVVDVPLRHVDEVMVAKAARPIGHEGEAQIGAVGEHRRQQGRFVASGIPGSQMHESVRESGPSIDIAQNFGGPCVWQPSIQSKSEIVCGLGDRGRAMKNLPPVPPDRIQR